MYTLDHVDWASDTDDVHADVRRVARELGVVHGFDVVVHTMHGPGGWPVVSVRFDELEDFIAFAAEYTA